MVVHPNLFDKIKQESRMDGMNSYMNYLNILFIIVPQGTLARVLVPRVSTGVEITPLSKNDIKNLCVNNPFLYNSIPQKENNYMFRENMF